MDSTDLTRLQRRVRWAYEQGRLRRALLGVTPVLVIVALASSVAHRPVSTLWFGLATVTVGVAMLWYGRDPQKAVLPGVTAGLIPLAFALCANHLTACGAHGCSRLCMPACALGGVVAGLAIASVGNQRNAGPWFWVSASALAFLTGAMGCACIGYSGVVGLGLGFGAGMVPGLFRRAFGGKAT
jgi:hypothetical protein